jgi:hypothetical protein
MKNVKILLTFCIAYIRILSGKTAFPGTLKWIVAYSGGKNPCYKSIHFGELASRQGSCKGFKQSPSLTQTKGGEG